MRLIVVSMTVIAGALIGSASASGQGTGASLEVSGVPRTLAAPDGFTMTISGSTGAASHAGIFPIYGQSPCAASVRAQLEASPTEFIAHAEVGELPSSGFAGTFTIHPSVVGDDASRPGLYSLCVFMEAPREPDALEPPEEESVVAMASTNFTVLASLPTASSLTLRRAERCIVPHVKGKKLASAERTIARAHCRVGTVRKSKAKRPGKGRVKSQSPRAGRSLPGGTKVGLVVSSG